MPKKTFFNCLCCEKWDEICSDKWPVNTIFGGCGGDGTWPTTLYITFTYPGGINNCPPHPNFTLPTGPYPMKFQAQNRIFFNPCSYAFSQTDFSPGGPATYDFLMEGAPFTLATWTQVARNQFMASYGCNIGIFIQTTGTGQGLLLPDRACCLPPPPQQGNIAGCVPCTGLPRMTKRGCAAYGTPILFSYHGVQLTMDPNNPSSKCACDVTISQ